MQRDGPDTLPLGSKVAERFRLERLLGSGGFGAVFEATTTDTGERVALKVLDNRVLEHVGGEQRFLREAELARRLDHPNVVRVLDDGVADDGTRFIAFELLEGRSVADEVDRWGPMATGKVVAITFEVLEALGAAHGIGIVHRDLKPANVYLLDGSDRVKVLDFGIAKSTNPNTMAGLTQEGMMLGTPMFMAPEQMTGAEIRPATDLFAVGMLMLEMLLGRHPYDRNITALELVRRRFAGEPVPIVEAIRDSPLGPVIARATDLAQERRFQTAREMAEALQEARRDPRFRDALLVAQDPLASAPPPRATWESAGSAAPPSPAWGSAPPAAAPSWGSPPAWGAPPGPSGYPSPPPHPAPSGAPALGSYPRTPQPWGPPTGAPAARERSGGAGVWVLGLMAVGFFAAVGVGFGIWAMARGAPPRRAPSDHDTPVLPTSRGEDPIEAPAPPTTTDRPTKAPSAKARIQPCEGVSALRRPRLRQAMAAQGWQITGQLTMCAGNMINFRCDGGGGNGFTATKGGRKGQAVVIRFGSVQAATAYVTETAENLGDVTLGGPEGGAVLYLKMDREDADALTGTLCR